MMNTKNYKGDLKRFLVYGATGSGKSAAFLTHPGKKLAYVFDPSGMETYRGYDVDVLAFQPSMLGMQKAKLGKGSKMTEVIRMDPAQYVNFEKDFEGKVQSGFFEDYDIVAFESITVLIDMMMCNILDAQGRGSSAPEIQDYYYRSDFIKNLVRAAVSLPCSVYFSAHVETMQDETSKKIITDLALSNAIRTSIPLLFSEVIYLYVDTDTQGYSKYYAQFKPSRNANTARCSLRDVKQHENVTIDWSKSPANQGLFKLYKEGGVPAK